MTRNRHPITYSRHHRLPRSYGGPDDVTNIKTLPLKVHQWGHALFDRWSPCEIAQWLNRNWFPRGFKAKVKPPTGCHECPYKNVCSLSTTELEEV